MSAVTKEPHPLKSNHDSAKQLREDVERRWRSIQNMAKNAMRGGNHLLVSYLTLKGIEEHQRYQQSSSNCDAYEFETGSRRADCLLARTLSCSSARTVGCSGRRADARQNGLS